MLNGEWRVPLISEDRARERDDCGWVGTVVVDLGGVYGTYQCHQKDFPNILFFEMMLTYMFKGEMLPS